MRMTVVDRAGIRFGAGVLGGLLAAAMAVPMVASAQQVARDVEMQDEAWYYRDRQPLNNVADSDQDVPDQLGDSDPTGQGLHTAPAIGKATVRNSVTGQVHRGEYIRVSVHAGRVDGISFVTFPLVQLSESGLGVIVTGGTVTFTAAPEADQENARQRNVEGAKMIACLTTEFVVPSEPAGGDWEDLPEHDCETSAPLEPVEGSEPQQWTVDLAPFTAAWADDPLANHGIAIRPAPELEEPNPANTFHVAFPNKFNDVEGAESPKAELHYEEEEVPDFSFPATDAPAGGFDAGGGFGTTTTTTTTGGGFTSGTSSFDTGGTSGDSGFAPVAADDEPAEDTAAEPEVADEAVEEEVAPEPPAEEATTGTNPALALIPLLGLGLAGLLGYSLSKDPELPIERQGAVSKLMERRSAAR